MILKPGIILYHGTAESFSQIQITGHSSPHKDFGRGFYLTSFFWQARKWAQARARQKKSQAYVYAYKVRDFDGNNYRILELLHYDKEWVNFLTYNRVFGGNPAKYCSPVPPEWLCLDIVYDHMADNLGKVIGDDLKKYAEDEKTFEEVVSDLSKPEDAKWDQFCFKTDCAIRLLDRIECCSLQAHRSRTDDTDRI